MLSTNQLADMEQAIIEEHRRDREALERLKRFLPQNGNGRKAAVNVDVEDQSSQDTIIGRVRELLKADPNKGWTVPNVIAHLKATGYTFAAKTPASTLGLTFAKLVKKKEARIAKRGSGRVPHVYKAAKEKEEETIENK